jgi:hypothetical protein
MIAAMRYPKDCPDCEQALYALYYLSLWLAQLRGSILVHKQRASALYAIVLTLACFV